MRSLGEFVGHIVRSVKSDPHDTHDLHDTARTIISTETEELVRDTPDGPVTLRRTTIEEIEYPSPPTDQA